MNFIVPLHAKMTFVIAKAAIVCRVVNPNFTPVKNVTNALLEGMVKTVSWNAHLLAMPRSVLEITGRVCTDV